MARPDPPFALYEKIKQHVIENIETGNLKPDDRVASETQLARDFNASRMTANRALKELTEEGRIVRIQGVGTFVARPKPEASLFEIKSIDGEIREWGGVHSCQVLVMEKVQASETIAGKMDLRPGDKLFHSVILHKDRDLPVQYAERYVNPDVAPDFLDQDFTVTTPSDYLLEVAPIQEAEHEIEAIQCSPVMGQYLSILPKDPCLSLTRRTWSFGRVATYSILISPGSRYKLKGKFKR